MLGVIALVVLGIWVFVSFDLIRYAHRSDYGSAWATTAGCLAMGTAVSVLIMAIVTGLMQVVAYFAWSHEVTRAYGLETLADGSNTTGSFFLGSGYIDEKPAFTFYRKTSSGRYVLDSVFASDAEIVQDNSHPRMEDLCDDYSDTPAWFSWPMSADDYVDCDGDEITFYVPQGSITNTYTLDAQ